MQSLYLEDLRPGDKFACAAVTLTESEIINFALKYDPQPFHLDTGAAEASIYGGIIASGFQVVSLCFRLFIQQGLFSATGMGSPGIDELRWLAPVRPGDTLRTEVEVIQVTPSRSKPDRGIAKLHYRAVNQRQEAVTTFYVNHLVRTRGAESAARPG